MLRHAPRYSAPLDSSPAQVVLVALVGALGVGLLAAATTPLIVAATLIGLTALTLIWTRPIWGMYLYLAVIAVLPFGVVPLPLGGAQLTFVDALLITTYLSVAARVVLAGWRFSPNTTGVALLLFVGVACAAFLVGSSVTGAPPELVRRFGKLVASLLLFWVVSLLLQQTGQIEGLVRGLMIAGAVQGAIGVAIRLLPPFTQLSLLSSLSVLGYPTTEVLRYVPGPNNTYTTQLRAIGTSVDPNVFGGTLMLALVLIIVQWSAPRPIMSRAMLTVLAIPTAAGMLLSLSRASWVGLACGVGLVGLLCYRRILVLGLLAGIALLFTPAGLAIIQRFISGFSITDRATAFRFGEYENALTLIQRYPLLGIGFGQSPDIDVTAGVSSVYLLVGEQTGLIGLAVYVVAVVSVWLYGLRGLQDTHEPRAKGLIAALFAAVTAALVTGLLDHYFANHVFPHAVALFWVYAAALRSAVAWQREPEGAAPARASARRADRAAVQQHQVPSYR